MLGRPTLEIIYSRSPPHLFERKNSVKDRAVTDTRKSEDRRHTSMPVFTKEKPSQMKIKNALSLRGTLTVPGDKSISHRSVMLGAIAEGDTVVHGFLNSADCLATIDCFRRMGVKIEELRGEAGENVLIVHGRGRRGLKAPDESLDAMNSGTTVRLLSGILAGQSFSSYIKGDASLSKRPMKRIIEPLREMGARIDSENDDNCLPLEIQGRQLHGITYTSKVASAQVKSCILLAGLYADGPTTVYEPFLSRNHTELMLNTFGGNIKLKKDAKTGLPGAIVYPGVILTGQNITVPGDISSAAYFIAAGLLVPHSEITLRNVGINQTRDGILRVCSAMGGNIRTLNVRMEGREPVADLLIRTSGLHGTNIGGALIPTLIDELPVIAVMAACAEGDTEISDAGELRVKESDRLAAIIEGLRNMGVEVDETETGMIIHGNGGKNHRRDARGCLKGAVINPKGDHRMAMAFTVAGLISSGTTTVRGTDCVKISYPNFYRDLESLGYNI